MRINGGNETAEDLSLLPRVYLVSASLFMRVYFR
jgi:hypothetical protein